MNREKWKDVKAKILDSFDVINQYTNTDDDGHGSVEIIEFKSPAGEMKVEFYERDLVLDKRVNYSNRVGSGVTVDYVYSDDEKTHNFKVYKKISGVWELIESPSFVS